MSPSCADILANENTYQAVGSTDMLPPPGRLTTVVFDGTEIVIANVNGKYHALDGLCEHAGGPLGAGTLVGCHLTCPLHAWTYDVTDGWLVSPSLGQRTKSYRVRIVGDVVEVALKT
ncbi:MAG: (2Fe-2S)-binding protein [Chloroflexi bacterium]|nr:(2Fe-2S)-binding protein [Chloroflexota bacterium]HCU73027.1 (2Fe-2S)-binding protein [Chloroflexota bacterium]